MSFEEIKRPHELLELMKEKIEYGFIGKTSGRKYSWQDPDVDKDFCREYFLQSPEELMGSGCGVCWDSTELERYWFEKNGYAFKVFFVLFSKKHENNLPTHTFLAYTENNKWYWFEFSFGDYRGIHEYKSLERLIVDVKKKYSDSAIKNCEATIEDKKDLVVLEFDKPKYGCNPQEFIDHALSHGV